MKKFIFITTLGILGAMALVSSASADTTISLTPADVNVTEGQNFSLVIRINPHKVKNGTLKIELEYPANLLEVKSFSFAKGWKSPFTDPEYDLIDNTNGVLIKTAGYPKGISSFTTFGTVLFSAKNNGKGVIKTGDDSFALNSKNEDVLNKTPVRVSVTIVALPPPQPLVPGPVSPPEEAEEPVEKTEEETPPSEHKEPIVKKEIVPEETIPQRSLLAMAIGGITQSFFAMTLVALCLGGLLLIGLREWALARKKKKGQ